MAEPRSRSRHGCGPRWLALGFGVVASIGAAAVAHAETGPNASDWSVLDHARVRLIDAGPVPGGGTGRLAGLQVQLDPGYLTYWRSPGEAGLPPSLVTAGSTDLKSAALMFPAPDRYSEGGIEAIGYKDEVVFPVLVTPAAADKPVGLKLGFDFGICERLCLPAHAAMSVTLDHDGTAPEAGIVRDAYARVPHRMGVGDPGSLVVTAVQGKADGAPVTVHVRSTSSDVPMLFAEAPDPWFVKAGEGLWSSDGSLTYRVVVSGAPADPAPLPLRLTLVGGDGAIEVGVTLDAPPPKP
ncbi:protein-disulfide reductase DsbD family protein [Lichenihabitans sp. Uapishka_5]|uniref:protein-disulfide reductase DsbD domain-containing protein n=1 Tax=Lichenihabitans sp. Uapishka_5 TaxID=3037302 RepID=UPI0029E7D796|nr:protein-disulfide reductase DsbD domain-containing protein [Lichenihabitans sp. Uapishka_5]MDX7952088.1 protein-disulfide reductase DsbD family protein [Lichenihabitans sp. Uapishka_5]